MHRYQFISANTMEIHACSRHWRKEYWDKLELKMQLWSRRILRQAGWL